MKYFISLFENRINLYKILNFFFSIHVVYSVLSYHTASGVVYPECADASLFNSRHNRTGGQKKKTRKQE